MPLRPLAATGGNPGQADQQDQKQKSGFLGGMAEVGKDGETTTWLTPIHAKDQETQPLG
jgi:hypothetical protein